MMRFFCNGPFHRHPVIRVVGLSIAVSFAACHYHDGRQAIPITSTAKKEFIAKDSVVIDGKKTTTISTSIDALGTLLNFKTCRPAQVKYKYIFIDNSGRNERLSVPGPSDYYLEALLCYDSVTFNKIREIYGHTDDMMTPAMPTYNKNEFMFDWLDKSTLNELENSPKNYYGHPDFFSGVKGKLWFLDKKILLAKGT
jgi:hypothetical protein